MKKRLRYKTHRLLYRDFRDVTRLSAGTELLVSGRAQLGGNNNVASTTQPQSRTTGGIAQVAPTSRPQLSMYVSPVIGFRVGRHTYFLDAQTPPELRKRYMAMARRLRRN